jgi:TonB family protein
MFVVLACLSPVCNRKIERHMTRCPRPFRLVLGCLFVAIPLLAQTAAPAAALPTIPPGANLSDPQALLPLALSANSLDAANLAPWHLTASFESFDEKGHPAGKGTFEEWRLTADTWKRTYKSDNFTQTQYETPNGLSYETSAGAAPWPLSLIATELIHPMPQLETDDPTPELRLIHEKQVDLNCLLFAAPLKKAAWPFGVVPTYCFKQGGTMLRLEVFDGSIESVRNEIAAFRGTYVAKEIALSDDGKPLLHIHLLTLSTMTTSEVAAITLAASATDARRPKQVSVAAGVIQGNKLRGPSPQYPVTARENHVQGTVVLGAVIGTDGRIHKLRVESSPDDRLSVASVAAVERWVYKPYTLAGEPVRVMTHINVVFRTP